MKIQRCRKKKKLIITIITHNNFLATPSPSSVVNVNRQNDNKLTKKLA